ncbi:MAG: cytochrome P450, partial [Anaerolineales bacterium]
HHAAYFHKVLWPVGTVSGSPLSSCTRLFNDVSPFSLFQGRLDSVLNGRTPATGDLPHMQYVFQVIQEAMRLYPAAWAISREPLAADALGEYAVRAGQIIYVAIYNVHHHPRYWPEPECFNPERFSPHGQAQWPHKHGYIPFGAGPRMCIGKPFGLTEAHIALAQMMQRFTFCIPEGHIAQPHAVFNMGIRDGLPVTVVSRTAQPQTVSP